MQKGRGLEQMKKKSTFDFWSPCWCLDPARARRPSKWILLVTRCALVGDHSLTSLKLHDYYTLICPTWQDVI